MGHSRFLAASALVALLSASLLTAWPAAAQSFDCAKATTRLERTICRSPDLRRQDGDLADAYARALAGHPSSAEPLRQAQREWLRERQACLAPGSQLVACLSRRYADRLVQLRTPPEQQPVPVPAPAPTPAQPVPQRVAEPEPRALPAPPPEAQAGFDRDQVPAAGRSDVLLRVSAPGRYALRAESATGTAIQLVDMLSGPGEVMGQAGQQDGRLDALLDGGTYKLRVFGADGAAGTARLLVTPFRDAAPTQAAPLDGDRTDGTLGDVQQRLFWLTVAPGERLRVEAAGRSLADLRLWRNGRDLVELPQAVRTVEASPGHPMGAFVLEGTVEPGTYLVAAYGGPARTWTDGSADQPFHLRTGASRALLDSVASGRIGPFGSEVFLVPVWMRQLQLILPTAAAARLVLLQDGEERAQAALRQDSRDTQAMLTVPNQADDAPPLLVELRGAEGQEYALRGFAGGTASVSRPGLYWLAVQGIGQGGDERPPGFVLLRQQGSTATVVVAGTGPRVGPNAAWRGRFNLRGATTLLFQVLAPAGITARTEGPGVELAVSTLDRRTVQMRGDGREPNNWFLEAGWYELRVLPRDGAVGVLDLTLGPPGQQAPRVAPAQPPSPVMPVGVQSIGAGETLVLRGNPGSTLVARPAPVDLMAGPIVATQNGPESLDIPIQVPRSGTPFGRVISGAGGSVGTDLRDARPGKEETLATLQVPSGAQPRTIALGWRQPIAALPAFAVEAGTLPVLQPGVARFLDLARDEQRSFTLQIESGGLYRIETLGRLRTYGSIGSAVTPTLAEAEANGSGQNMRLQPMLRPGRYHALVQARQSAGRTGIVARPAPLLTGTSLLPHESARMELPAGIGAVFPIQITEPGRYHIDLLGLRRSFTARLEDGEGWPITSATETTSLDEELAPGQYRLLVLPGSVDARMVARLMPVTEPVANSGHGPHSLPFDQEQHAEWREPPGRDAARTPDAWDFALHGPSNITLALGVGMLGELRPRNDPAARPVARVVGPVDFTGVLAAGDYRFSVTSLGRNDRLGYTVQLRSEELQPATPRSVTLPATVPLSIAGDRVVALTTFGQVAIKAALRTADGQLLASSDGRGGDWNIALSRQLAAGRYVLELAKLEPEGRASKVSGLDGPATAPSPPNLSPDTGSEADSPDDADDSSTENRSETPMQQSAAADDPSTDAQAGESSENKVEVTLRLPDARTVQELPATGLAVLEGGGVRTETLPPVPPQSLTVAAASAAVETVLILERQDDRGAWVAAGEDQGLAPVVAVPADGGTWRARVWAVDGGTAPIRFGYEAASAATQPLGSVTLAPGPGPDFPVPLVVAAVAVPDGSAVQVSPSGATVLGASQPGRPATPFEAGMLSLQGDRLWLLRRGSSAAMLTLRPVTVGADAPAAVSVPASGHAVLRATPAPAQRVEVWIASSGFGQPGIDGRRGMGVAPGSAFALVSSPTVRLWNAGSDQALRLRVRAADLTLLPVRQVDTVLLDLIPPGTALPVRLPPGGKRLSISLAAGIAAVTGWHGSDATTAWAGDAALTRSMEGDWTELLLINPGSEAASASLALAPGAGSTVLRAGTMLRRFEGAAGTLAFGIDAQPGETLRVAGAEATVLGHDGQVRRGRSLTLSGPGTVVLAHGPGLLAAWIEGQGALPGSQQPAQPVTVKPPATVALSGDAMTLDVRADAPSLLHLRSLAPLIVAMGPNAAPDLFASGVAVGRYLPAGSTALRILSPDGNPLSGTLELTTSPIPDLTEGIGASVAVPPGGTALWGLVVTREGPVGVGVQSLPDLAAVRLLDAAGQEIGQGVSILRALKPGRYVLSATVPPDGPTTLLRPAAYGLAPPQEGPPAETIRRLMLAAGLAPPG